MSLLFALWPAVIKIQVFRKSFSRIPWPQNDHNHWSVKSTLCALNTHPWDPSFTMFRSTTSRDISRYRFFENRNALNDPRMTLITEVSKVSCVHWILTLEAQISLLFTLQPTVFEIQVFQKSKSTQWPQNDLNHLSVKSTICTLNIHPRDTNFISLYDQPFSRYRLVENRNAPNDPRMTLIT